MGGKKLPTKLGLRKQLDIKLGVAAIPTNQLGQTAERAAAAAQLFDMVRAWREAGIAMGALHDPGAVTDLLREFGMDDNGRMIGRRPAPGGGFQNPGMHGREADILDVGLPRNQRHHSTTGLGMPSFRDILSGSASKGGTQPTPTPVPGQSSSDRSSGGKWESHLMTDGSRVSSGEGWRGGAYHIFTTTESATGESKTTTVIVTQDGRTATFTDVTDGQGRTTTTASGNVEVITDENNRRTEGGGNEFDESPPPAQPPNEPTPPNNPEPELLPPSQPRSSGGSGGGITINVDPDSPYNSSPWGYYNPFTGQYWGPYQKLDANQVNPGRGDSVAPSSGPRLTINPDSLVINPNPVTAQGPAQPISPRDNNPNQVDPPPGLPRP